MTSSYLTPHHRLLFDLLTSESVDSQAVVSADWDAMLKLSARLRISTQLFGVLTKRTDISTEVVDELRRNALYEGATSFQYKHLLGEILERTSARAIPVLLLKGCHAILDLYENPAERMMADLDIMVAPEYLEGFEAVMIELGFESDWLDRSWQKENVHHVVFTKKKLVVEGHWDVGCEVDVSPEDLMRRAQPISDPFQLGMAPEERLIYLCHHIAQHDMIASFYHYTDLYRLLARYQNEISLEKMAELSRQWGGGGHRVRLVLSVLQTLFPRLSTDELQRAVSSSAIASSQVEVSLGCILGSPEEIAETRSISQRPRIPRLLLPDYEMRLKYHLAENESVPWYLHLDAFLRRARRWLKDFVLARLRPKLKQKADDHKDLIRWLHGAR